MSEFWDNRYSGTEYAYGTEPNAFLVSQCSRLKVGMRALAVGDGEGRNGVWLAQQGLEVLSVDASAVGLAKAQALAIERGARLATEQADLLTWQWPVAAFDVVVAIFVHFPQSDRQRMHRAMYCALEPGGLLILEGFTQEQLRYKSGGPPVREMLYTKDILAEDFAEGEVLLLEEAITTLNEGPYHRGEAAVVRLVVRRGV